MLRSDSMNGIISIMRELRFDFTRCEAVAELAMIVVSMWVRSINSSLDGLLLFYFLLLASL